VSEQTRRVFVKRSAGAALGATVIGALMATEAEARTSSEAVVAYVHDGKVSVMTGDREVTVRDRKLAAQIVRAGGN
jgi:hypothetical protein